MNEGARRLIGGIFCSDVPAANQQAERRMPRHGRAEEKERGDLNREVEWWDVEEEERRGKVEFSLKRPFVSSSVYSSPQFFTLKPLRHSTVAVPLRVWRRVLFQGFPFGILCIVEVWNTSVRQWTSASGRGTLKISYLAWVQVILSTTEKRD